MSSKDSRADASRTGADQSLKRIERFLKVLTWQMVILLLILAYIAIRPQAGRYQFLVQGEEAGLFDTAYGQARLIKMEKEVQEGARSESSGSETPSAGESDEEVLR